MSDTTITSNDESRKEVKKSYVSDEEVRKTIKENWGEELYIAAIAPEFIEIKEAEQDGTVSSTGTGRRKRIRVRAKASKGIIELITDSLVTVGTKEQKDKVKKAREAAKFKRSRKEEKQKSENELEK